MIETVSLGFPLARLDKKRNRLEILAPANEYGEHGFLPPQFIPISGKDDIGALADLLAPYASPFEDYARHKAALMMITCGQGDPQELARLAVYPHTAEGEKEASWLRAMRAHMGTAGNVPARPTAPQ